NSIFMLFLLNFSYSEFLNFYLTYFVGFPHAIVLSYQALLAINRCCAIVFYAKYNDLFGTKRSKFYFLFCFLYGALIPAPFLSCKYVPNLVLYQTWRNCWVHKYVFLSLIIAIFAFSAIFTIVGCYIAAFFVRKHQTLALQQSGNAHKERRFLYQASI